MGKPPINLNVVRAEKAADARLCKPVDILRALVDDIESGTINPDQLFVSMLTFDKNNPNHWNPEFRCAGMHSRDILALLDVARHRILNRLEPDHTHED